MSTNAPTTSPDVPDVLVVGGGAAGLAAAVALSRSLRSVLVVDSGRPRNAPAAGVHNYLGREGVSPTQLYADGRRTLESYGGAFTSGEVTSLERLGTDPLRPWFRATLADGRQVEARRVVVTTGLVDELPDLPGLRERWGRDVLHCPYCHGYEARGTAIGILSSTTMTAHQALMFRQLSEDVTVLTHTGPALPDETRERLEARGVRIVEGEVVEVLVTDDALSGVRLASGEVVALQNLAIAAPAVARSGLLADLGVEVADLTMGEQVLGAYAVTEPTGATSVPGLYAAGNVAAPQAQVSTSAANGLMTGAFVNGQLIEEETAYAVEERRATAALWDERYAHHHGHGGTPNPTLVDTAGALEPGTALDLGCGRGEDVLWLAREGWRVLGVDASGVAVAQAQDAAAQEGLADRVRVEQHDLAGSFPAGEFDLVTTHYLHSTRGLPRTEVLRRATRAVAPGGTLLVVGHATLPPWAWRDLDENARDLPTAEEVWESLGLGEGDWELVRLGTTPRAVSHGDEHGTMDDSVVVARRLAPAERAGTAQASSAPSPASSRSTSSASV
ncbi:Thioredoxin reductase [Microlunatus sagamiharensis]|uniref:Thioredoxin reductase n=1 Tax=Microlunatus sagamiharensis TaxID=546874 RepID=A0A1H2NDK7_9ACTN|nr:FAD-dependent oxidoreductase [Microlunatus sagamiharensis]SDV02916.1 Thioredoxin reductase [Microlunatus sagamiharensis]